MKHPVDMCIDCLARGINTLRLVVTCQKLYLQFTRFCCDLSTFYRYKDDEEEKDGVKFPCNKLELSGYYSIQWKSFFESYIWEEKNIDTLRIKLQILVFKRMPKLSISVLLAREIHKWALKLFATQTLKAETLSKRFHLSIQIVNRLSRMQIIQNPITF